MLLATLSNPRHAPRWFDVARSTWPCATTHQSICPAAGPRRLRPGRAVPPPCDLLSNAFRQRVTRSASVIPLNSESRHHPRALSSVCHPRSPPHPLFVVPFEMGRLATQLCGPLHAGALYGPDTLAIPVCKCTCRLCMRAPRRPVAVIRAVVGHPRCTILDVEVSSFFTVVKKPWGSVGGAVWCMCSWRMQAKPARARA